MVLALPFSFYYQSSSVLYVKNNLRVNNLLLVVVIQLSDGPCYNNKERYTWGVKKQRHSDKLLPIFSANQVTQLSKIFCSGIWNSCHFFHAEHQRLPSSVKRNSCLRAVMHRCMPRLVTIWLFFCVWIRSRR